MFINITTTLVNEFDIFRIIYEHNQLKEYLFSMKSKIKIESIELIYINLFS